MNIPDIHQFEFWIETGFAAILAGLTAAPVYDAATWGRTMLTPNISIKSIIGSYIEHRHKFSNTYTQNQGGVLVQNPFTAFDAYNSTLEVTVTTNRQDNQSTGDHRRLLGLTRARMLLAYVWQNWGGQVIIPQDVRPLGTADSFINEDDCDVTVMVHEIPFVVNTQGVWPATI